MKKYTLIIVTIILLSNLSLMAQKAPEKNIGETEEVMPQFPGGEDAFYLYLDKNVITPKGFDSAGYLKENGNQYVPISVFFTVEVDGAITDVKVLEKGDDQLDKKAIEIVKNMPKWKPGTQNGNPIKVKFAIPVRFNLKQ